MLTTEFGSLVQTLRNSYMVVGEAKLIRSLFTVGPEVEESHSKLCFKEAHVYMAVLLTSPGPAQVSSGGAAWQCCH